jgi:3-oxoacyl-[acyl-carrier-protein] synthase-3
MAARTGILGLGAYVPERVMTNRDWAQRIDTSDEWIVERSGIRERRFAGESDTTVDLGERAARAALADADLAPEDVDELIVASDTPEAYMPDTASFLQHRLGLRSVPAFDLAGSGCAGFLQALDVARSRAIADDKRILVCGIELISRLMDWEDRNTCVLFGDGAGAVVVGRTDNGSDLIGFHMGTDGSRADILSRICGGTRMPFSLEMAQAKKHLELRMEGKEVFKEAVSRMTSAVKELLQSTGTRLDDVALFVPHQANLRILHAVAKHLDWPVERMLVNVDRLGNTGSASVPIGISEARDLGRIGSGDLVLCAAFGAGFHWGAGLLRL